MLGASSFPAVSTGFTSDSKAMVPAVSSVGEVKKMSPLETMQEVFFDIRDGILILGDVFSEKISGLNEHLAFRFESLNSTLLSIAGMTDKQLDIDNLYIKEAFVGKSLSMKRFRPRAKGRASSILKPFSKLTIILEERTKIQKGKDK